MYVFSTASLKHRNQITNHILPIVYFFIGCVALGEKWYQYIPGSVIAFVGIAYAVLEFIPSIEPPANMRDADAGWGAEQV